MQTNGFIGTVVVLTLTIAGCGNSVANGPGCQSGYSPATNNGSVCCPNGRLYAGDDGLCYVDEDEANGEAALRLAYDRCEDFGLTERDVDGQAQLVIAEIIEGATYSELLQDNITICDNLCTTSSCSSICLGCLNAVVGAVFAINF